MPKPVYVVKPCDRCGNTERHNVRRDITRARPRPYPYCVECRSKKNHDYKCKKAGKELPRVRRVRPAKRAPYMQRLFFQCGACKNVRPELFEGHCNKRCREKFLFGLRQVAEAGSWGAATITAWGQKHLALVRNRSTAKVRSPWAQWARKRRAVMKMRNKQKGVNLPVPTCKEIEALIRRQGERCALTGRKLEPDNSTLDHDVPLSRGGAHAIENLIAVVNEVNDAKRSMTVAEFVAMCKQVAEHAEIRRNPDENSDSWAQSARKRA